MTNVYAVYATEVDRVGVVEVLFATEQDARDHARARSAEPRVLAASVIRFSMGETGSRRAVGRYRDGEPADRR